MADIRIRIISYQSMFNFLWKKKEDIEFNLASSFIVIEFLTEDEKVLKDKMIKELQKQYEDDNETIIPYAESFKYSFRYTLNSKNLRDNVLLAEIMALVQTSTDQQFNSFYESNVNKIKLHMKNDQMLEASDIIKLYNQREVSCYNPKNVLEVIYQQRGLLKRIKLKGKKIIKELPKTILSVFAKLLTLILRFIGLGSVGSVVSKVIPLKMIINWLLGFLMLFFPMLAPLIGLGKMMI